MHCKYQAMRLAGEVSLVGIPGLTTRGQQAASIHSGRACSASPATPVPQHPLACPLLTIYGEQVLEALRSYRQALVDADVPGSTCSQLHARQVLAPRS